MKLQLIATILFITNYNDKNKEICLLWTDEYNII